MVNGSPESVLSGPQLLAIAYTPHSIRAQFRWLLMFDQRLQSLVNRAREPLIAQMRLAWWRDVLVKEVDQRPRGEPLLADMAALGGDLVGPALRLVDACDRRIAEQFAESDRERATAICGAFADWTGVGHDTVGGVALSLAGQGDGNVLSAPRALRPLTILALAAQLERGAVAPGYLGSGLRLSWHALTGR
jgi:15-cis-phytoene synthase